MQDLYNRTIERNGKTYRYDPDYDCYYRVYSHDDYAALSHWNKYNWLYCIVVLSIICYYVQFTR